MAILVFSNYLCFLEIKIQLERKQKEHKILLLGCGKAGKSTLIKQMRIIHSNQFTQKERTEYRNTIAINIATTLYALLDHADWNLGNRNLSADRLSSEDQLALQVIITSPLFVVLVGLFLIMF